MQWLYLAIALVIGSAIAALAIWAARRYTQAADEPVEMEVIIDDASPVTFVPPKPAPVAPAPAPARAVAAPPRADPRGHAERAPAMVLTQGVSMQEVSASRGPQRQLVKERPPMREPPPMKTWAQQVRETAQPEVASEWARRQVGPVEPGRVAGACGGCGARLSVSTQRPLRIACPVCGRTKLLAA